MLGGFIVRNDELDYLKNKYNSNENELVDINHIKFDNQLPLEQMLDEYIVKVGNPYHFRSGTVEIEVLYTASTEKTVSELLKDYFLRQK